MSGVYRHTYLPNRPILTRLIALIMYMEANINICLEILLEGVCVSPSVFPHLLCKNFLWPSHRGSFNNNNNKHTYITHFSPMEQTQCTVLHTNKNINEKVVKEAHISSQILCLSLIVTRNVFQSANCQCFCMHVHVYMHQDMYLYVWVSFLLHSDKCNIIINNLP